MVLVAGMRVRKNKAKFPWQWDDVMFQMEILWVGSKKKKKKGKALRRQNVLVAKQCQSAATTKVWKKNKRDAEEVVKKTQK